MLDHPKMVQRLYGTADKEWARICLAEGGSGDISNFLKNPKHIHQFKKPMSILRAFSSKLTTLNHSVSDYEPPALNAYSVMSEAYMKYELPDQLKDRNGGSTAALNRINLFTYKKYGDRYVLSQSNCRSYETPID